MYNETMGDYLKRINEKIKRINEKITVTGKCLKRTMEDHTKGILRDCVKSKMTD